jgi:phosphoglycolate phosphatase-like HAD superfamily hydrolase
MSSGPGGTHVLEAPAASLESWNDGTARAGIVDFVTRVTKEDGPDFVPAPDRIAVFDNDGTLWAEQPAYFQLLFALDRVKALAPQHPEWKDEEPHRHVLSGDLGALAAAGEHAIVRLMATAHSGMTTEEFAQIVKEWLHTARHPRTGRPYTDMTYRPMLELLDYLRAHGFRTFIVSGGGVEFMRAFAESAYGIPPEQVVGSQGRLRFERRDGKPVLVKEPEVQYIDDGPGKPASIQTILGRRPVAAFGNSDGDHAMLQWTMAGSGPRLALLVHHTDAEREWAYDRQSRVGRLDKALDEAHESGWTIVDMRKDWKRVFRFE